MKKLLLITLLMLGGRSYAQTNDTARVLFAGMDLTWINGKNRQKELSLSLSGNGLKVAIRTSSTVSGSESMNNSLLLL